MKRSDFILELVKLYDSIPPGASSYHICDMLIRKAERLGMLPVGRELTEDDIWGDEIEFHKWEEEDEEDYL